MPSVPQSLLWISLVVLWLFVLVPMLVSKRDAVRRTSDVALATRVLNSGVARKFKKGPAAGHRSDPHWRPIDEDDDEFDDAAEPAEKGAAVPAEKGAAVPAEKGAAVPAEKGVVVANVASGAPTVPGASTVSGAPAVPGAPAASAAPAVPGAPAPSAAPAVPGAPAPSAAPAVPGAPAPSAAPEQDCLDVDVVEADSGALPVGGLAAAQRAEAVAEEEAVAEDARAEDVAGLRAEEVAGPRAEAEREDEPSAEDSSSDEDEPVKDASGLEASEEPATAPPVASRRRLYESKTAAVVSARKYRFRTRVLSVMALILVATIAAVFTVWPDGWWACGTAGVITTLYLVYLRRQTRIEERLRRRRMQRMARSRIGVQNTADRDYDVPSRLRRHGSVVLEIDDEDPNFEHLDYAPVPTGYNLPKAAGQ